MLEPDIEVSPEPAHCIVAIARRVDDMVLASETRAYVNQMIDEWFCDQNERDSARKSRMDRPQDYANRLLSLPDDHALRDKELCPGEQHEWVYHLFFLKQLPLTVARRSRPWVKGWILRHLLPSDDDELALLEEGLIPLPKRILNTAEKAVVLSVIHDRCLEEQELAIKFPWNHAEGWADQWGLYSTWWRLMNSVHRLNEDDTDTLNRFIDSMMALARTSRQDHSDQTSPPEKAAPPDQDDRTPPPQGEPDASPDQPLLDDDIPHLDDTNWITQTALARKLIDNEADIHAATKMVDVLRGARPIKRGGRMTGDGKAGIDRDGRKWRQDPKSPKRFWYYVGSVADSDDSISAGS